MTEAGEARNTTGAWCGSWGDWLVSSKDVSLKGSGLFIEAEARKC